MIAANQNITVKQQGTGELKYVSMYLTEEQFDTLQDAMELYPNCGIRPVEVTVVEGCLALLAGKVST